MDAGRAEPRRVASEGWGGVDGKIGRAEGGGKELDMKMDCRVEG